MNILYPLGLLGLIGVAILIIIYIIKPKYQEKKVSSTYIWRLSLKYFKRKIPFQWLTKSFLFIIQIVAILLATLLLMRPYINVDAQSSEKIIIIENSASMQQKLNDSTRFQEAIKEAKSLASSASEDEKVSLILCQSEVKYLAYREDSPSYLEYALDGIEPTYEEAAVDKAIELASQVLDENYKAEVILFSDNKYEKYGYVTFRDMSRNEVNASIIDFKNEFVAGYYEFDAKVAVYNQDKSLKIVLNVDGTEVSETTVDFANNEFVEIELKDLGITSFTYAELILKETDGTEVKDSFNYDNKFCLYGITKDFFKVQIIGENSIFTNAAIHSLQNKKCSVYVPATPADIRTSGYDLYIFNNVNPSFIPNDGHIWIINPVASTSIEELDLEIGAETSNADSIIISDSQSPLIENMVTNQIVINQYQQITESNLYDVVLEINDNPILLNKMIGKQRIDVINIDVHYSNIALTINLPILINNLIDETLQYTSDENLYTVGESTKFSFKINCDEAYINNSLIYSSTKNDSSVSYQFDKPGNYVVNQRIDNTDNKEYIYVKVSENELDANLDHGILAIDQYVSDHIDYNSNDVLDRKDFYLVFALALLVLFTVEWVVQYREQY